MNNNSGVIFSPAPSWIPASLTFETANLVGQGPPNNPNPPAVIVLQNGSDNTLQTAAIKFDPNRITTDEGFLKVGLHELGHSLGLGDVPGNPQLHCGGQTAGASVMNGLCEPNDAGNNLPTDVTSCDNTSVNEDSQQYPPPPSPDPEPDPSDPCAAVSCTCGAECMQGNCGPSPYECSPVILAVGPGSAYRLTSADGGVRFDLNADGIREKMAWTEGGDPVAFLVLDRNGNGTIDDGTELFGNHSVVPSGQPVKNGFEALEHYDRAGNGGNDDRVLDHRDQVWASLSLWVDWNHNGVSEADELYSLPDWELSSVSLDSKSLNRSDGYGNVFRLKAPCKLGNKTRFAYDVFFSLKPQRRPN